jgi:hypothetical protein
MALIAVIVLVGVMAVISSLPDLKRYMRIKRM